MKYLFLFVFSLGTFVQAASAADKVTCYKLASNGSYKSSQKRKCSGSWHSSEAAALSDAKSDCARKSNKKWNDSNRKCERDDSKKYCTKIQKLESKAKSYGGTSLASEISQVSNSGNCTKEQYKDLNDKVKDLKKAQKDCIKLSKLATKASKENLSNLEQEISLSVSSNKCDRTIYKAFNDKFRDAKKASKNCDKISKLLNKSQDYVNADQSNQIKSLVSAGNCTNDDYKKYRNLLKDAKSAAKNCDKLKKVLDKAKPYQNNEFNEKLNKVITSGSCSREDYRSFNRELKDLKKQSKNCEKIEKLAKKNGLPASYVNEVNTYLASAHGSCSSEDYKRLKKAQKESKKSNKYCDKILSLLTSNKLEKDSRWLSMTDPNNAQAVCTKDDYNEANCLAKGKVWFKKNNGKYSCVSEKKAFKKMAKMTFKECVATTGDRKNCRIEKRSLKKLYKSEGQKAACVQYVESYMKKINANLNDEADGTMLDRLKAMKCIDFNLEG